MEPQRPRDFISLGPPPAPLPDATHAARVSGLRVRPPDARARRASGGVGGAGARSRSFEVVRRGAPGDAAFRAFASSRLGRNVRLAGMRAAEAAAEAAAKEGAMLPPTPPDAVQSASLASGSGKAKTKASSKPISDKPWDSSKVPAAPSRSPARPSPDREAKSAHIEARSELLSLIASHAAEELGDELGAAAMVDVALPPPKLALAEAAARKKAAADAEEERARRQAAVEKLADRVAKHNDTRARRVPRSGDDAEVESTSAVFRPPSAATPDSGWAAIPSVPGPDDGGPGETAEARAARKAAREANKPWRAGMRRPGSASGRTSAPDSDARDAAERREESERRKAEVQAYIRESKARWKVKLPRRRWTLRGRAKTTGGAQDGARGVARGGARRRRETRRRRVRETADETSRVGRDALPRTSRKRRHRDARRRDDGGGRCV